MYAEAVVSFKLSSFYLDPCSPHFSYSYASLLIYKREIFLCAQILLRSPRDCNSVICAVVYSISCLGRMRLLFITVKMLQCKTDT